MTYPDVVVAVVGVVLLLQSAALHYVIRVLQQRWSAALLTWEAHGSRLQALERRLDGVDRRIAMLTRGVGERDG